MKKIVLAEKPSVGKDIAKVLKCFKDRNGYIEGDKYIVTWALGHLVTLADPESYGKEYMNWNMENLPILPKKLKSVVIKQTRRQFDTVLKQLNRQDVDEIIIATDAGREGELVARWIIEKAKVKKNIKRLWISSVTEKAIKDGFNKLKDGREYYNLYQSALTRAESDWYVGINGTRALTCKYNTQLSCGRVQTPTLAMVNIREEEIQNFKSQKYFGIEGNSNGCVFNWIDKNNNTRTFNKENADQIFNKVKNSIGKVTFIEKKTKKTPPMKLYNLTELQKEANRIYNFSGKETLSIMQTLYERHKVLTYPRTDSSYISEDIVPTLKDRLSACKIGNYGKIIMNIQKEGIKKSKNFVDNSKVSDHHAIIPTEERPILSELSDREMKIYEMVVKRFLNIFLPDYQYEEIKTELNINGEKFVGKNKVVLNKGWKSIYSDEDKEEKVFSFKKDDEIKLDFKIKEGVTSPPARFTEGTILGAMESPAKYMETDDKNLIKKLNEAGGIGTVATRADIIEKLFNSFLIEKKGNEIHITSKGRQLLNLVPEELKSPLLTAEWEMKLEKISQGKLKREEFLEEILFYSKKIVSEIKSSDSKFVYDNLTRNKCPECGKYMLEVNGKKGKMLVCQDRECGTRKGISKITNARCPICKKKLELRGTGDSEIFICKCGYREKMSSFKKRREESKPKVSKNEVKNYMKKQKSEEINNPFADLLSGFKLDK